MAIYMFHYVKENMNYYHFDANKFEEFVKTNKDNIVAFSEYVKTKDDSKIVLSFDDGTIDHYSVVFPILKKYNVAGVFSVCDNVFDKKILDIQKIHTLMELVGIDKLFEDFISLYKEKSSRDLIKQYGNKERVVKQLLQRDLPAKLRKKIINKLLKINDIKLKFDDVYLNKNMIREMQDFNNEFAYHTINHNWLGYLSYKKQFKEIKNTKYYAKKYGFLNAITLPFGNGNDETFDIVDKLGIDFVIGIEYSNNNKCFSRVDCNLI